MKFENTGIENQTADLTDLTEVMRQQGFILDSHWDYERVTYDKQIDVKDDVYYLRVQGIAIEGDVGGRYAKIKLKTPFIGKYHFPHGLGYDETESLPKSFVEQCQKALIQLKEGIDSIQTEVVD